jgi:hypothetical protein
MVVENWFTLTYVYILDIGQHILTYVYVVEDSKGIFTYIFVVALAQEIILLIHVTSATQAGLRNDGCLRHGCYLDLRRLWDSPV